MAIRDHERLTGQFFRRVNSAKLFEGFFEDFRVWKKMGLTLSATDTEIHAAWEVLECPGREDIREALCRVNDLGREQARDVLLRRAESCGLEDAGNLTVEKLAMVLYLDHRAVFDEAYSFFMLEKTENLHTLVADYPVPCKPSEDRVERFKAELRNILAKDALGPRLRIEVETRHADKWMAAIPHEEHVAPDHVFDARDNIITSDRRPVYEMVLIYHPATGVLKLKVGKGKRRLKAVAAAFAEHVLGRDLDFFANSDIVDFEPLRDPDFSFAPLPGDQFERARPVQVTYWRDSDPDTVYHVRQSAQAQGDEGVLATLRRDGIDLDEIAIRSLSVCFNFPGRRRQRTVAVTAPNGATLDETDRDRQ